MRGLNRFRAPTRARKLVFWSVAVALASWLAGCLYYYNAFVAMTSKLAKDLSDCQVAMQERHHVTVSLAHVVIAYSRYVNNLLTGITDLRARREAPPAGMERLAGQPASEEAAAHENPPSPAVLAKEIERLGTSQLQSLLSRIRLVAEQYPQLRLTETFQQLGGAIVEAEHRVAGLLIQYNGDVNAYMTVRTQWPGCHFAAVLSFKRRPYMEIDPLGLRFREVTF